MAERDEDPAARLRQRLWGASVLIAIAVIGLPLLLDGAGSESQFRRVEKLRDEPPRIINQTSPTSAEMTPVTTPQGERIRIRVGEDDPPDYMSVETVRSLSRQAAASDPALGAANLRAWVVQAGSFADQENALAVRNVLRRAGFATFVTDRNGTYRVQVGPMVDQEQAEAMRRDVVELLEREAIVVPYP